MDNGYAKFRHMKSKDPKRLADIQAFSSAVRKAGKILDPKGVDAAQIRALANYLGAGEPAVKKWWYGQNAPSGWAAAVILEKLKNLELEDMDFDVADLS